MKKTPESIKIKGFTSSWKAISDVIHNMKGAINDIIMAINLLKRGVKKLTGGLLEVDEQINKMANGDKDEQ